MTTFFVIAAVVFIAGLVWQVIQDLHDDHNNKKGAGYYPGRVSIQDMRPPSRPSDITEYPYDWEREGSA